MEKVKSGKKRWKFQVDKGVDRQQERKGVDRRGERRDSDRSRRNITINTREEVDKRVWVSKTYATKTKRRSLKGEKEASLELESQASMKMESVYPLSNGRMKKRSDAKIKKHANELEVDGS